MNGTSEIVKYVYWQITDSLDSCALTINETLTGNLIPVSQLSQILLAGRIGRQINRGLEMRPTFLLAGSIGMRTNRCKIRPTFLLLALA
jgi:hypothetical protein